MADSLANGRGCLANHVASIDEVDVSRVIVDEPARWADEVGEDATVNGRI